jgi:hypothetical protein
MLLARSARPNLGINMPTKKYMCIQRSPLRTGDAPSPPSPAQMQEMFASFNAWKEKYKDNIVDMGGKLMPGGKILSAAGVTDGPFVEVKEIVGGFMIIAADSLELALEVARESPGLMSPGSSIEVRELSNP